MSALILDEFTRRTDVSRQRRYQLRNGNAGLCVLCSEPAVTAHYCERHRRETNVRQRELMRRIHGRSVRYKNAESYAFAGVKS
jgi:hypothetical protein